MNARSVSRFRRFLWCLPLLLVACPQASPAPSAVELAACDYVERCAPGQLRLFPGGSVEGCAATRDALLGAPGADDCAELYSTLECDGAAHVLVTPAACAYAPPKGRPRVGEGEDCSEAWCDEGLWCSVEWEGLECSRRVCRALRREGEACRPAPCASGLGCHPEEDICVRLGRAGEDCPRVGCESPLACVEGTCGARRRVGERCADDFDCHGVCDDTGRCAERRYAGLGASCEGRSCEPGLRCDEGRCRTWGDVGEPCEPGAVPESPELLGFSVPQNCRLGLGCVDGRCTRTAPGIAGAGQVCDRVVTHCDEGLYCSYDGRCEVLPAPRLGEACNPHMVEDYGFGVCIEGFCDRDQEVCVPYAARGERCLDKPCGDNLTCLEGTCQTPKPEGEACESHAECGSRAWCDEQSGVCRCG